MKRAIKILLPILLSLTILICLAWYLLIYDREFTRDMLLSSARYFESQGNHNVAAWFYDRAYEQSGDNDAVAIELAQQHKNAGNYTRAEYTLSRAIEDGGGIDLYIALSKTYIEQDKILDAVKLLDGILNPEIRREIQSQRPAAPVASPEPGFYSQYISVALQAQTGTIYANNIAQYPSIHDAPYSQPIPMVDGENTIYTVAIADNGLVSPLSILGYTIGGVIEEVSFADPAIEAQIRSQLSVDAQAPLYSNDLWKILSFQVPAEATSLEDLRWLPYLNELVIADGISGQLHNLSALTNLTTLSVTNTSVSTDELAVIGNLPQLTRLTLNGCGLSTTTGLERAVNLTYLDLSNNTIRNIQALSAMPQLQEVYLQHNALTSLSALARLTNVTSLDVSYNTLTTLAPIDSLAGLKWLDVSNNQLTDLAQLNRISGLTYLVASYNHISDLSALSACTGLIHLDVSNNALTDISVVSAMPNLTSLNFSTNQVAELPSLSAECMLIAIDGSHNLLSDLNALSGLKQLNNVYMDYNPELTSVEPLASCPVLIQANVYGTKVTDVSALTRQSIIVNYDPTQME